jgi:hypothetical protein
MNTLGKLLVVLSELVDAWYVFRSTDGDIGYFEDIGSTEDVRCKANRSLLAINEEFESLKSIHRKLLSSKETCQRMAEDVSYTVISRLSHNRF